MKDWPLNKIEDAEIVKEMSGDCDPIVLRHVLRTYSSSFENSYWRLDLEKLSVST